MMQGMQQQQQMMMMLMTMMMMMMMQQNQMMGQNMPGMGGMNGMPGMGGGVPGMGGGSPGMGGTGGIGPNGGTPGSGSAGAVGWAEKFLGHDSSSIKGKLPNFDAAGGITNNCADFVTACLENSGDLTGLSKLEQVNVKALEKALINKGWKQVSRDQAQPGDVCMNASRGHVELVSKSAAQNGGKVECIGSNGSARQTISRDSGFGNQSGAVFYRKP